MKNRIPPPIWMIVCGVFSYLGSLVVPAESGDVLARSTMAAICLVFGVVFLANSVLGFIKSKTTVNPLRPDKASSLVISGVYRYSRNPMYLGMLLFLCALALYIGSLAATVGPIMFGLLMNTLQITPEEQALRLKFGQQYVAYCSKVRRWL